MDPRRLCRLEDPPNDGPRAACVVQVKETEMGHDIEAVRAKAEASFRKPEHTGESSVARAEREVREQIERLRQLRLAKEARERLGAEIRGRRRRGG